MNEEFTQKNVTEEDWSMSDPGKNLPPNQTLIKPIEDWSMTGKLIPPEQGSPSDWKMPEPKFRATSGSLPEDFLKKASSFVEADTQPLAFNEKINHPVIEEEPIEEADLQPQVILAETFEQPAPSVPIEPQPDVAEVFSAAEITVVVPPEEKQRSQAMQMFLAVLGLSAMLFFAVAFLVIVYFLFFYKAATE